jgi:putative ABC transport system permease protein
MTVPADLLSGVLGVIVLVAIATAVLWARGVPHRWAPALAVLRGMLQLAVISVILAGIITDPVWVTAALLVMFIAASSTSAHRLGWSLRGGSLVVGAMAAGIVVSLSVVFLTGAIQFSPRYALAIGGIVIGNSMSIATLAGRRFTEMVGDKWEEVEGWLALGATPRQSTLELAKQSVYSALIPSVDQSKTTGLVTLPGAFVGAIFGGVSPLEAGRVQIVVLAAIMAAGTITAVTLIAGLAPVRMKPRALK